MNGQGISGIRIWC